MRQRTPHKSSRHERPVLLGIWPNARQHARPRPAGWLRLPRPPVRSWAVKLASVHGLAQARVAGPTKRPTTLPHGSRFCPATSAGLPSRQACRQIPACSPMFTCFAARPQDEKPTADGGMYVTRSKSLGRRNGPPRKQANLSPAPVYCDGGEREPPRRDGRGQVWAGTSEQDKGVFAVDPGFNCIS